ncbi:vasorin-like [Corticium candelabrum]|uniref:vasorin-like n=1 Tax=Corticium candelabrum TaxID=121492 RepID=UPI002E262081|nr:vasorin-like [Corticium candelabrum]
MGVSLVFSAISGNAVTAIDRQAFHGLGSLEVLVLSNNAITSLPFGLFSGLSSLTRLSVVMNQLSELPDAIFSDLTKLERLDLRTNNLQFLSAGVLHGIPYTSVIELKSNPLNCSCSFLHILNYTLGNNALCYYPWQRRQQKLADLNETELCTVYPPTTQPPQVVTIPTRTATMLNTTTQSSGPTTPADRLRTSSISTSDRVTSPSLPSLHSTTTPSQQHHVTTSSDTTHDDVTSSPVTREQNHTHSSVISTSSPVTKKDKTLTENSNPATIDSTVKSTSDVTVKSHSDVAIATVSTVGLVDYYRDTLTNLSTQTISSANAASVVSEIVDLVSNPSWLNSNDVDEVTTLLERALSLSTSPALLDNIVAVTNHLMDLELPVLQDTHRDSKASSR